ncbi:MAG: hypothetical protein IJP74_10420 [Prevotella sp.]|nr:hypothetical protein [Prevotella sp.]
MKIFRLTYGLLAAAALSLTSCDINNMPEFSDSDAFIAFRSSSVSVGEADGSVEIPVMLTSLGGMSATVPISIVDSLTTAKEGTDFAIETKELSFSPDANLQSVKLTVYDNDVFTGTKTLVLALGSSTIKLGAAKTCTVSIQDDEHPLRFILGTYSASADSYFSSRGHYDWDITVDRDESDINKVWIGNLDPFFLANGFLAPTENYFYGFVSDDKTEIRVPNEQKIGYEDYVLAGFTGPDPDESDLLGTGDNIIIQIEDGGNTLVIPNAWGITGWYNLFYGGVKFTKK